MRKRNLNTQDIDDKIIIYDLLGEFSSTKEILEWISKLNKLQIKNILSLNILEFFYSKTSFYFANLKI